MSNTNNTPQPSSTPRTLLAFPPLPLASGNTLSGAGGSQRTVTAVTVLVSLEGTSAPVEVTLESKFGGWWAPVE